MLRAVVTTHSSGAVEVAVEGVLEAEEGKEEFPPGACERTDLEGNPITTDCPELNPIAPEMKELVWGFGAFVVFAVVLRYLLYPKLRDSMRQRYDSIQADKASAVTLTDSAKGDVAAYEAQVAAARAEAHQRVEAARASLEAERNERLTEVNARIAEKRAAVVAELDAAKAAAMGDIESAVTDVAARATEIAIGRSAPAAAVESAVRNAMGSAVSS